MTENTAPRDGRITWLDILLVIVLGGVLGVVISLAAMAVATAIALAMGVHIADPAALVQSLKFNFTVNQIALITSDAGFLGVTWWIARRRSGAALAAYFPPIGWRTLALALLSGIALSLAINGGNELLSYAKLVRFHDTEIERAIQPHNWRQYAFAFCTMALFAPFFEEFFFRGLLLRWLSRIGGAAVAVLVTAVLFAAVHGQFALHPGAQGWLFSLELFLAGVVLALWVKATGSLRASFATHAAYNGAALLFSVLFP